MLSVFPYFLSFDQVSPFLIRLVLAVVFIHWAYKAFKDSSATANKKGVAALEGIAGVLLLIGLWTQVATIVAAIILIVRLIGKIRSRSFLTDGVNYYLILLVLSLSLLVTGAGVFSFDLPL